MTASTQAPHPVVEIHAVLFDMGGVLVQLDSLETVLGPSTLSSEEIWNGWILSDAVRQFERGQCSVDQFAETIIGELKLEGTPGAFVERFLAFPRGLYPGTVELMAALPEQLVTGVLSNTSAIHWENQQDADIVRGLCHRSYLSYEMGLAKPDREIYEQAVADLAIAAEHVLFIDDNQINVDGAVGAGLQAGLAKGPDQARGVLRSFGVLD